MRCSIAAAFQASHWASSDRRRSVVRAWTHGSRPPIRRLARQELDLGVLLIRRHDQTAPQFGDARVARSDGITPLGLSGPQVVAMAATTEDVVFVVGLKLQEGKLLAWPSPRPVD